MPNERCPGRAYLRSLVPVLRVLLALCLILGGLPIAGGEPISAAPASVVHSLDVAAAGPLAVQTHQPSTTFLLPVQRDTYLDWGASSQNFGSSTELFAKRPSGNDGTRPVLGFDLAQIPAQARVLSATVHLFAIQSSAHPLSLHRVTSAWAENTATWASLATAYDPTVAGSLAPNTANQFAGADVTPLVQAWVAGGVPNFGVILVPTTLNSETRYAAKEWGTQTQRPYLEVVIATDSIALTAQKDTAIWKTPADQNYGACDYVGLGTEGDSIGNGRPLFQFDLASLPSQAVILSAHLQLTKIDGANVEHDIGLYAMSAAWDEGSGGCVGATQPANWTTRQAVTAWTQAATAWTQAGGDYDPTAIAVTKVNTNTQYIWDVTGLVGQWNAGSRPNHGVLLGTPDQGTDLYEFASREHADPSLRPRLIIKYASTTATVAGQVWDDANRNGLQENGEGGLARVSPSPNPNPNPNPMPPSWPWSARISRPTSAMPA